MSQAGRFTTGSGAPVVETLTGDSGGAVGATNFNINIFSSTNTPGAGLTVVGNPGASTLDVQLFENTVQTTDDTITDLFTFTLSENTGALFEAIILGFATDFARTLNGHINASGRRAAGTADTPHAIVDFGHNSPGAPLILVDANGNDIRIRVQGEIGFVYNWRGNIRYMTQS